MIADGVTRFLRQYLPFAQMEQAALEFLVAHLDLGYYSAGTAILDPAQAEPRVLCIIQRGTVQVETFAATHGGDAQPVSFSAGECFSVSALLEQRPVMAPYTAVTDTFCYEFPAARFAELLDRSPVFREFALSGDHAARIATADQNEFHVGHG
jgi:CBS domain-containing protein